MTKQIFDAIQDGTIKFSNLHLDTRMSSLEKNEADLARFISKQSSTIYVHGGERFIDYLSKPDQMLQLTDFLTELHYLNSDGLYYVNANIELIDKKCCFNDIIKSSLYSSWANNINEWFPEMLDSQKAWHLSLTKSVAGLVGFPGFEWAQSRGDFLVRMLIPYANTFIIGTKKQLNRYKQYDYEAKRFVDSLDYDVHYDSKSLLKTLNYLQERKK